MADSEESDTEVKEQLNKGFSDLFIDYFQQELAKQLAKYSAWIIGFFVFCGLIWMFGHPKTALIIFFIVAIIAIIVSMAIYFRRRGKADTTSSTEAIVILPEPEELSSAEDDRNELVFEEVINYCEFNEERKPVTWFVDIRVRNLTDEPLERVKGIRAFYHSRPFRKPHIIVREDTGHIEHLQLLSEGTWSFEFVIPLEHRPGKGKTYTLKYEIEYNDKSGKAPQYFYQTPKIHRRLELVTFKLHFSEQDLPAKHVVHKGYWEEHVGKNGAGGKSLEDCGVNWINEVGYMVERTFTEAEVAELGNYPFGMYWQWLKKPRK